MNWGIYSVGILSGVAIKIIGEIISPTIAELGAKLHAKVWRKPYIRGQLAEDLSTLESIEAPLLRIHAIPRYPSSYKNISEWLLEIDTKARKIRYVQFQYIKEKLIAFASPMNKISVNTSLNTVLDFFVKEEKALRLVEEIRDVISKIIIKKKKK